VDFDLTSDQAMLRDTVRRFVNERVKPEARSWDEAGEIPDAVLAEVAAMGLLGVTTDPAWEGAGFGPVELVLVVEELARGDGALALTVAHHNALCAGMLARYGSSAQKERYLTLLSRGDLLGGWAVSEPQSGDDPAAVESYAARDGSDWILNGTKMLVTHGTRGGLFVVFARTDDGVTAFLVEPGTDGMTQRVIDGTLGMRASDTGALELTDVRVPDGNRIGELGAGPDQAETVLALGRVTLGAIAVGLGRGAVAAAREYAIERKQFGRPIADFQAVQWKLADCATGLDAAGLLVSRAAWLAASGESFAREAAMAKLHAADAAMHAADESLQIHGGFGFTAEFPVERYYRDVKLCAIAEGTSELQRVAIAASVLETSSR
jgi:alkylation response protein AidB-like acyl-CoA dehydrogenase